MVCNGVRETDVWCTVMYTKPKGDTLFRSRGVGGWGEEEEGEL